MNHLNPSPYLKNNAAVSSDGFTHAALEPAHSVVVRACAGSGKTWLLTSRIIRLLIAGVAPKHILAITFTKKAAQEMRDRVAQLLREMADGTPAQVVELLTLRGMSAEQAQASVARAQGLYDDILGSGQELPIHTFDAWFYRLLKAAPMGSGVSRDASLLVDADELREAAWQGLFERFNRTDGEVLRTHYLNLVARMGEFNVKKMLGSALYLSNEFELWLNHVGGTLPAALAHLREEIEAEAGVNVLEGVAGIEARTRQAILDLGALTVLMRALDVGDEKKKVRADSLQQIIGASNPPDFWALLRPHIAASTGQLNGTNFKLANPQRAAMLGVGISEDDYNDARDAVNAQLVAMQLSLADLAAYSIHEDALPCVFALLEQYRAHKRSANAVEFSDVSRQCFELLNSPETAAFMQTQLDARYQHLLFDEFQDTNPVQWGIIHGWLSAYQGDAHKPRVFLVGDVKQSIYRFRDADSTLFGLAQDYLVAGFDATVLQTNFTRRNSPAVVDWVNQMFMRADSALDDFIEHSTAQTDRVGHIACLGLVESSVKSAAQVAIENDAAEAVNELEPATEQPTAQRDWLIEPALNLESTRHDDESAQLVQAIRALVGKYPVWDEELKCYRAAQYSDCMILIYGRTHLTSYERLLRQAHIPFESTRRGGLMDTLEALDLMALLKWLLRADDDWALVQVLRAPMFAVTDAQLLQLLSYKKQLHTESGSPVSYWQALGMWVKDANRDANHDAEMDAWRRIHGLLSEWLHCAHVAPPHDVLDRIYAQGDIYQAYARVVPTWLNPQVQSNLRSFLQLALNVDAGRYPSVRGLLSALQRWQARDTDGVSEGEPLGMHNAVKILTVHASKGLESPIVMLIDMRSSKPSTRGGTWMMQRAGGAVPMHLSWLGNNDTRGVWRAQALADEAALNAKEHYNKCYVAMTRAKQLLIVSAAQEMNEQRDESGEVERVAVVKKMDGLFEALHETSLNLPALPHAPELWPALWTSEWQKIEQTQSNQIKVDDSATESKLAHKALLPLTVGEIKVNQAGLARWHELDAEQSGENENSEDTSAQSDVQSSERAVALGVALHSALEWMSDAHQPQALSAAQLARKCALSHELAQTVWQMAQDVMNHPEHRPWFDPTQYDEAHNEMALMDAQGRLKRIDRWVRQGEQITVIDYKSAWNEDNLPEYQAQVREYINLLAQVYPQCRISGVLLRAEGGMWRVQE